MNLLTHNITKSINFGQILSGTMTDFCPKKECSGVKKGELAVPHSKPFSTCLKLAYAARFF